MKKIISLTLLLALANLSWAYHFSAVAPSGDTLYYEIEQGSAKLVYPNASSTASQYNWTGHARPTGALIIPDSVSYNGQTYAVTAIGNMAFMDCTGITSVTLPATLTYIDQFAFAVCTGITSLTIPPAVTYIGDGAFTDMYNLRTFYFNAVHCTYMGRSSSPVFDNPLNVAAPTTLVIGDSVQTIPPYAFKNCRFLSGALTLPSSVTRIGDYAFQNCLSLASVSLPCSLTRIGNYAFQNDSTLSGSITFPSTLLTVGGYAFHGCSHISGALTLPHGLDSIGGSAFANCTGLTSLTIPSTVTYIGNAAFYDCSHISSLTYRPVHVANVYNTLVKSPLLSSVTIGDSVDILPRYMFNNCSTLTCTLHLPATLTQIGDRALYNCSSLTGIACDAVTPPTLGSNVFYGIPDSVPVAIPCGTTLSYARVWNTISNFVEPSPEAFSALSADESMGTVAVISAPSCAHPEATVAALPAAGYRFLRWDDSSTFNPRTVAVTQSTSLTAYFTLSATDTVVVHDTLVVYDTLYISDTVAPAGVTLSVTSSDPACGVAAGNGIFPRGTAVEIAAIPVEGCRFVQWADGVADNPRTVVVESDTAFVADFVAGSEGLAPVAEGRWTISVAEGRIRVADAAGLRIRIFDSTGRCLVTAQQGGAVREFDMPAAGLYLVQVADAPARRVIIAK